MTVLHESRDFREDRSGEVAEAAQRELDAAFDTVAAELTTRWGAPRTVDLWPARRPPPAARRPEVQRPKIAESPPPHRESGRERALVRVLRRQLSVARAWFSVADGRMTAEALAGSGW
ncbi:hypothetical protein GCM10023205_75240 [Yinghuangia aomiensis]|uniref:Uncharacterized protein n=1 Tax=Yinghuangia aomiensis TaxID=676205 RepID=A0ABP9IA72_9ACTN